jgi:hypothetical protein
VSRRGAPGLFPLPGGVVVRERHRPGWVPPNRARIHRATRRLLRGHDRRTSRPCAAALQCLSLRPPSKLDRLGPDLPFIGAASPPPTPRGRSDRASAGRRRHERFEGSWLVRPAVHARGRRFQRCRRLARSPGFDAAVGVDGLRPHWSALRRSLIANSSPSARLKGWARRPRRLLSGRIHGRPSHRPSRLFTARLEPGRAVGGG